MAENSLKKELDIWYEKICKQDFISFDPVKFPRFYTKHEDIEIAAFLSSAIAWGRRDIILRSAEKMFALMTPEPAAFVMGGNYRKLKDKNIHRTFFEGDLKYFCKGFRYCYAKYGSLENLFSSMPCIWQGIELYRQEMAAANEGRYNKHACPDPNSACKRINLALRWLVRKGPVDIGLWKNIKPSALYIPLDVHVMRNARRLGLLQRKSNDKKAVIELTEKLREFNPEDPVKYDFALFSM